MSIIIRLQNLPWSANSVDIRRFFSGLSIPEGGVHIVGGEMGDAFIAFSTDEDARLAMAKDGGKIKDMQIKLLLSSRTEMMRVIEQARQQNMIATQPQVVAPQTAILSMQPPARIMTPTSEPERKRGRSPSPRRRSRDRSPVRDRRRSPDDRRGSRRDRSRSPRGSRSRDMDRRSDRFKRDDRRYDDSRYRDDRHSSRESSQEPKKYFADADHVNSRSQLHATEGFRNMQPSYEQTSVTAMPAMYPFANQQLPAIAKTFSEAYAHPNSSPQLSQGERGVPNKTVDFPLIEQKLPSSGAYPQEQVRFHGAPFTPSVPSSKESSVPASEQRTEKPRRRSRFEPEFAPSSTASHFTSSDTKPVTNQLETSYSARPAPDSYSDRRGAWPHETAERSENAPWNDKRQALLSHPPVNKNGDFLQVVPMDLDPSPPEMTPEKEIYPETIPSRGPSSYARSDASPRNDDLRRDNQSRGAPLLNDAKGPPGHDRGIPGHSDNRGMPSHSDNRGISGHSDNRGISSHSDRGISSHADNRGISSHADNRGISSHADNRGISGHGDNRGISGHDSRGISRHGDNRGISGHGENRGISGHGDNRDNRGISGHGDNRDNRGISGHGDNRDNRGISSHGDNRDNRGISGHGDNRDNRGISGHGDNRDNRGISSRGDSRGMPSHPDSRGMPNHPDNRGMPSHPENREMPSHADNRGMPSRPDNRGMPSRPDNRGMPSHPDNRGMPSHPDNRGMPSHADNRGMPSHPDNRGMSGHGDNRGINKDTQSRVPPSLTVEVRGLPPDARIDDILDLFRGISLPAANIRIEANDQGLEKAFIRFVSVADFEEALSRNRRFMHEGRCELVPCPADEFDSASRSQKSKPKPKPREEDLTIQLRGLPFSCKDDDVISFFDGLGILDLYVDIGPDGRASGTGFVEFGTHEDFRAALAMNGKMIGHRYITISVASKEMMAYYRGEKYDPGVQPAVPRPNGPYSGSGHPPYSSGNQGRPPSNQPRPPLNHGRPPIHPGRQTPSGNQVRPPPPGNQARPPPMPNNQPPPCISMKGLPEGVTNRNIADFLGQVSVMPHAVHIMLRPDKTPSGDAFAEFNTSEDLDRAMELNGKLLNGKRVSIQPIPFHEMSEILGRPNPMPPPPAPAPLLRTPGESPRPRWPLLPQGPGDAGYRERPRMEPPNRGSRPFMGPPRHMDSGRPYGPGRMRGPWPKARTFNGGSRPEGRFPPPPADLSSDFGAPGCVVSINNLHFRAGLEELLDFFKDYNITKDNVIRRYNETGQTTGEARVAFQSPRDAQKAVRELNQKPIMRRPLSLSLL